MEQSTAPSVLFTANGKLILSLEEAAEQEQEQVEQRIGCNWQHCNLIQNRHHINLMYASVGNSY